ncbi:unnamed protein product, partial [Ectocarpus fasciculatus]
PRANNSSSSGGERDGSQAQGRHHGAGVRADLCIWLGIYPCMELAVGANGSWVWVEIYSSWEGKPADDCTSCLACLTCCLDTKSSAAAAHQQQHHPLHHHLLPRVP